MIIKDDFKLSFFKKRLEVCGLKHASGRLVARG